MSELRETLAALLRCEENDGAIIRKVEQILNGEVAGDNVVDRLAREIEMMSKTIHEVWGSYGNDSTILLGLRGRAPESADDGPKDRCWSRWEGIQASGETFEMSLLDLKARVADRLAEAVAHEETRFAESQKRIETMNELLKKAKGPRS
jgi:hypothetical protein